MRKTLDSAGSSGLLHQAQARARGQRVPRSQQQAVTQTNTGKNPSQRTRLGPCCRAKRPLFLSHPPRARALHPTRNTRWDSTASTPSTGWACVVDEPPRPPGHQGVGLFAHGLAGNPRPVRSSRRRDPESAGNPRASWLVPSPRQQWPDHSSPGDPRHPRTCRVGMVRPAQVRVAVTTPTQPPASCPGRHRATPRT